VAKGFAAVAARDFVTPDDVKSVSVPVLAHRVGAVTRRGTEATRPLVGELLGTVAAPAV
jgi:MoxR-like ATPase